MKPDALEEDWPRIKAALEDLGYRDLKPSFSFSWLAAFQYVDQEGKRRILGFRDRNGPFLSPDGWIEAARIYRQPESDEE